MLSSVTRAPWSSMAFAFCAKIGGGGGGGGGISHS